MLSLFTPPFCDLLILSFLTQCSSAATVAVDLDERGLIDLAPPGFPVVSAKEAPLEVGAQKAELVGARQEGTTVKTGVQPGQVLDSALAQQTPMPTDADQVDQPHALVRCDRRRAYVP